MIVDKAEGLNALERAGMRVARFAYVDSAEDAIAFAGRREARDERFVPISLRPASKRLADRTEQSLLGEAPIRDAFDRLRSRVADPILAQIEVEDGTDVSIHARVDEHGRKFIELRGRTHSAEEPMPLDEQRAHLLAENYSAFGHKPPKSRETMLEHCLLQVAKFVEESGVEQLSIEPLRLHESTYSVLDATMTSEHPLHAKPLLRKDARDRKGHYVPSGRQ
jgi:hypothetical protein